MGPHQSGPSQQAALVRPVTADRSDRSHQRSGKAPVPRMEYRVKEKEEDLKPTVDAEKIEADAVVQMGNTKVATKDAGKEPMVIEKSVDVPV